MTEDTETYSVFLQVARGEQNYQRDNLIMKYVIAYIFKYIKYI